MNKRLLAFSLIFSGSIALSVFTTSGNLYSEASGAPASGSCTSCHFGSDLTDASMVLTLIDTATSQPVTVFEAGKTYGVKTSITKSSAVKMGFLVSANTGTLKKITSSTAVQIRSGYATHTSSGTAPTAGFREWNLLWTAPATGSTAILTAYINAANGDGTSNGDEIYKKTASFSKATGLEDVASEINLNIYPQPASDKLYLSYDLKAASSVKVELFDLSGRQLGTLYEGNQPAGMQELGMPIQQMNKGIYVLRIAVSGRFGTFKIMLQ